MDAHLARDAREEREWQLHHGVKAHKAADARIHLFDGNGRVSAAEGVDPALRGNGIGHGFSRGTDVLHLGFFDAVHDRACV